jgi:DNA-binding IclR family transcriptional regulator
MNTSPRSAPLAALLQRVREEYREMPNLRLTPSEAQRLFGLEPSVCAEILETLVKENFLSRTGEGVFVRSPMH